MQTFLPYRDFKLSAKCLDMRRLGKQRVETLQLLQTLLMPTKKKGWINHPAAKMWRDYEESLIEYGIVICEEWLSRGYKDTCKEKIQTFSYDSEVPYYLKLKEYPLWLGNEAFHASHRSNLLRKDPVWYGKFGWEESDDLEYIWPV